MFSPRQLAESYFGSILKTSDMTFSDNLKEANLLILGSSLSGKSTFINNLEHNQELEHREIISYHEIKKKNYVFNITKLSSEINYVNIYKSILKKEHQVSLVFFSNLETDIEIFDIWFQLSKKLTTQQIIVIINKTSQRDVSNNSYIEMYCLKHDILHLCIDISNNTDIDVLITLIISIIELKSEEEPPGRKRSSSRESCSMILQDLYS